MPYYYDTIRNPSAFRASASAKNAENFDALFGGGGPTAVSKWGRKQLFASRLICKEPGTSLPLLDECRPNDLADLDPCICHLITGYGSSTAGLANMQEAQIVRRYEPDTLAYVWAALAPFLRGAGTGAGGRAAVGVDVTSSETTATDRPQRDRRPPIEHANFTASDAYQIGSSSPTRPESSDGSESSIGFAQALSAPLLEEATIRLASCFIRCVLNYGQPLDKNSPFVHFRDERQTYNYSARRATRLVEAIDDGGLQLFNGDSTLQVAMLEGKRTFQAVIDGRPIVSDGLLAQLAGEALSLKRDERSTNISKDKLVFPFMAL
jgi:hypothetical protein